MTNFITGLVKYVTGSGEKPKENPKVDRFNVLDPYGFLDVKQFFHALTTLKDNHDLDYTVKDGFTSSATTSPITKLKNPAKFHELLNKADKLSSKFEEAINSFLESKRLNLLKMSETEISSDIIKLQNMYKELHELKSEIKSSSTIDSGLVFLRKILSNQKPNDGEKISKQSEDICKKAEVAQKKIETLLELYKIRKGQLTSRHHKQHSLDEKKLGEFQKRGKSISTKTPVKSYVLSNSGEALLLEKMKEKYLSPMKEFQSEMKGLKKNLIQMNGLGKNLIPEDYKSIAIEVKKKSQEILKRLDKLPEVFEKITQLITNLKEEDGITPGIRQNIEVFFLDVVSEYNEIFDQEEEFLMFSELINSEIGKISLEINSKQESLRKLPQTAQMQDRWKFEGEIKALNTERQGLLEASKISGKLNDLSIQHLSLVKLILSEETTLAKNEPPTKDFENAFAKFKKISEESSLILDSFLKSEQADLLKLSGKEVSSQIEKMKNLKQDFENEVKKFKIEYKDKALGKTFLNEKIGEVEKNITKIETLLSLYETRQKELPEKIDLNEKNSDTDHENLDDKDNHEQQAIHSSPVLAKWDNTLLEEIDKKYLTPMKGLMSDISKLKDVFVNLDLGKQVVKDGLESVSKNIKLITKNHLQLAAKVVLNLEHLKKALKELEKENDLSVSARQVVRTQLLLIEKEFGDLANQYQASFPALTLLRGAKDLNNNSPIHTLGKIMEKLYPNIKDVHATQQELKKTVKFTLDKIYEGNLNPTILQNVLVEMPKLAEKSSGMVQKFYVDRKKTPLHQMNDNEMGIKLKNTKKEMQEIQNEFEQLKLSIGKNQRFGKTHLQEDLNKIVENLEKGRKIISLYERQKETIHQSSKTDYKKLESMEKELRKFDALKTETPKKTSNQSSYWDVLTTFKDTRNTQKDKSLIFEKYLLPMEELRSQLIDTKNKLKKIDFEELIVKEDLSSAIRFLEKSVEEEIDVQDVNDNMAKEGLIRQEDWIEVFKNVSEQIDQMMNKLKELQKQENIGKSDKITMKEMLFEVMKAHSWLLDNVQRLSPSLHLLEKEMKHEGKKSESISKFIEICKNLNKNKESVEKSIRSTIVALYKEEIDKDSKEKGYVVNPSDFYG